MADPAFAPVAFDRERQADSPGIADLKGPDGMHTTQTMDYGIVLQGEIVLELDDGHCTRLSAEDIVTQSAVASAADQPVTMAFVPGVGVGVGVGDRPGGGLAADRAGRHLGHSYPGR
ncbi:cupin domain-containing protein [Streptomyces sp. LZ34]